MQWLLSNLNPMLSLKTYPKMAMAKSRAKKSDCVEHNLPWTSVSHFGVHPQNYTPIFQLANCMHATIHCCPKIEEGLTNIARLR